MRVNIVVTGPDMDWIGGRFARELVSRLPTYGVHAAINGPKADLEYQQIVYGRPTTLPAVGMFTHGIDRPIRLGMEYTGQIALNNEVLGYLQSSGAPDPCLIPMPVADCFIKRPIVFGVSGSTKADGRKGEHLVAKMVEAGYTVIAWGRGWPCEIVTDKVEYLPRFYQMIDYYVDTSSDEGGCVPALECLALGKPVISHTVGVDRPVLGYEMSNWESLHVVLKKLTTPRTYNDWARDHAAYFKQVLRG